MSNFLKILIKTLLICSTFVYATDTVKDALNTDTGYTKEGLDSLKEEYNQKFKDIFLENNKTGFSEVRCKNISGAYFRSLININKYDELLDEDIDLATFMDQQPEQNTYLERTLFSEVCLIGEIESVSYDTLLTALYHSTIKVRVDQIITGNYFFAVKPAYLYIKSQAGMVGKNRYAYTQEISPNKQGQHLFYLKRKGFDFFRNSVDYKKYYISEDTYNFDVFLEMGSSRLKIVDGMLFLDSKNKIPLNKAIKKMQTIEAINDPANFYKLKFNDSDDE